MIKLRVVEKHNEHYKLTSADNKLFALTLQFCNVEDDGVPEVNDYISISAELLNPRYAEYTTFFAFGKMDDVSGRSNLSFDDVDVMKVEKNGRVIFLKRLYG